MKILKKPDDMIGKKIKFIHVEHYGDKIILVSEDGEVLLIEASLDDLEENQLNIVNESSVLKYIDDNEYIRKKLSNLNLFDMAAYKKRKEEEAERKRQEYEAEREKAEFELYQKLKLKYESKNQ